MTAPLRGTDIPEDIIRILKSLRKKNTGEYRDDAKMIIASMNKAGQSAEKMAEHLNIDANEVRNITEYVFSEAITNTIKKEDAKKYKYFHTKGLSFDVRTRAEIAYLNVVRKIPATSIAKHFDTTPTTVSSAVKKYRDTCEKYRKVPHGLREISYRREDR